MSTSSARPDALIAYPAHTAPSFDAVERQVGGIDETIYALRNSSRDYLPLRSLYGLERELLAAMAEVRSIDERVGEVGRGFLEADSAQADGGGVVTAPDGELGRAAHGIPTWLRTFVAADVFNFWGGKDDEFPKRKFSVASLHVRMALKWLGPAAIERAETSAGAKVLPYVRWGRWVTPEHARFPTFNNKIPGRAVTAGLQAARLPGAAAWMKSPGATVLFRRAGVVAGVVSTGFEVKNLVEQGDPRKAYQREGAGYVADVARTGFTASSTAFLVAPTPVTAGAMLVTGVAWAGAEAWDHWGDDVSAFADETWDAGWEATSDAAGVIGERASDAWEGATSTVSDAWDDAASTVSDVRRGADQVADVAGDVVSSVTDRLPSFSW